MPTAEALSTLLDSPDATLRMQGAELAMSLGPAGIDAFFSTCALEDDGLLWRPPGLRAVHLSLLPHASLAMQARVRRLIVTEPMTPDALAALARLPSLVALTLSGAALTDANVLHAFPDLQQLTLERVSVDLSALSGMTRLTDLTLERCTLERLDALAALPLRTLSLEGSTVAPAPLPPTLTALNLLACQGTLPDLAPLRLHTLRCSEETLLRHPGADALREIEVDRCVAPHRLKALPIQRLTFTGDHTTHLEDPLSLAPFVDLPQLEQLRIAPDVSTSRLTHIQALRDHPRLTVLEANADWRAPFAAHWVGSPRQLQRSNSYSPHHPMSRPALRDRTAQHWWSRGHHYGLSSEAVISPQGRVQLTKKLRSTLQCSISEAYNIVRNLSDRRLPCLRLDEALRWQGVLQAIWPCRIYRWWR